MRSLHYCALPRAALTIATRPAFTALRKARQAFVTTEIIREIAHAYAILVMQKYVL